MPISVLDMQGNVMQTHLFIDCVHLDENNSGTHFPVYYLRGREKRDPIEPQC